MDGPREDVTALPHVKSLFHAALDRAPEERGRFLAEACGEREDDRLEVERLLAAHYEAGTFIEHYPVGDMVRNEPKGPMTGRVLGQYEVGRLLGSGGMGAPCTPPGTSSSIAWSR